MPSHASCSCALWVAQSRSKPLQPHQEVTGDAKGLQGHPLAPAEPRVLSQGASEAPGSGLTNGASRSPAWGGGAGTGVGEVPGSIGRAAMLSARG